MANLRRGSTYTIAPAPSPHSAVQLNFSTKNARFQTDWSNHSRLLSLLYACGLIIVHAIVVGPTPFLIAAMLMTCITPPSPHCVCVCVCACVCVCVRACVHACVHSCSYTFTLFAPKGALLCGIACYSVLSEQTSTKQAARLCPGPTQPITLPW